MEQPINILIVDDEPKNLTVLETIFDDPGYRLVRAETADKALLALVAEEFALLILDIRMPGMTGLQLAQVIKERKKTAEVPIIFLTAYYNQDQHVLAGYGTGAVDYLEKPVNATVLRAKVAVFAALHRKSRENERVNRALRAEVTERCRAEERLRTLTATLELRVTNRTDELRASEERLRLALEAASMGSWDWDILTGELLWSQQHEIMFGYAAGTPRRTYADFQNRLHPEDAGRVEAALRDAIEKRADERSEFRVVWPDGSTHWIAGFGRFHCNPEGRPVRMLGTVADITAAKEAELQLTRAKAQLQEHAASLEKAVTERTGELRSAVATLKSEIGERQRLEREILAISEREQGRLGLELHDNLAQQLTGIVMFAFALRDDLEAAAHPCSAAAARLVVSLNRAVNTTRHLSKSFFPVELEHGGLILALEDLAHRTEALAQIRCEVKVDAGFSIQQESVIHLYRIVQESIGNALKHGHAKRITIECRVRKGVRSVRVCDDGVAFKQPEQTDEWSGMGLHLFQYRARLLGATIAVKAMGKGRGCQVVCRFPPPAPPPTVNP